MSNQEQDSVVRHDDTIEIKNLNRVSELKPTDLLVLDDGFSSCNAITLDNFRKDLHKKIFEGEGLPDFKQVIKDTIATELLTNDFFINQAYEKVITKLKNNESSVMDSILSKVTNKFKSNLPENNLNKNHYFIGLYYSTLKKIPAPEYLTGISNNFSVTNTSTVRATSYDSSEQFYRNTVHMSSLKYGRYILEFGSSSTSNNEEIVIQTESSYDDKPIYLIVKVKATTNSTSQATKRVSLKYSYSSKRTLFLLASVHGDTGFEANILKGWYIQKNVSGAPLLVKL